MVLFLKEDLSDKLLSIAISGGKELQTDIITMEYSIWAKVRLCRKIRMPVLQLLDITKI